MEASQLTLDDLDFAASLVKKSTIAVQAGGHWGVWAKFLAERFSMVYTFEPEHQAFHILEQNCFLCDNIIKMQACLGMGRGPVGLNVGGRNGGSSKVEGSGEIPIVALDTLNLPELDLLYLDIEGFEPFALEGAQHTILRCKPVIALEMKGLSLNYGVSEDSILKGLDDLGYRHLTTRRRDRIFVPKEP